MKEALKRFIPAPYATTQRRFEEVGQRIDELSAMQSETADRDLSSFDRISGRVEAVEKTGSWISAEISKIRDQMNRVRGAMTSQNAALLPKRLIEHLDYHLVDHCNLNCAGCSTFSPLAPKRIVSFEVFERDLARFRSIVGDRLIRLHLLGGEPLLHPEIESFISASREIFPSAQIDVTTNGVLVEKMSDSFWSAMSAAGVDLKFTRYPIPVDYDALIEKARERGVMAYSAGDAVISCFRRTPLNVKGACDVYASYLQCPYVNCPQLREGRLYRCPACGMSDLLNESLASEGASGAFRMTSLDYIDIFKTDSLDEVLEFISNPIPFCRYCDMGKATDIPWQNSKRDLGEWVDLD